MRAPPDGYTLLCAPQLTFSITHLVFAKAAFDTRGLEPISVLATYPLILIARAGACPFNMAADLIAYARANPGKINYGHQGKGKTGHLLGELLMLKGNFRMTEIPYRGSAPAINDLLAGNIDLVPDYLLANKANIDAGKLKLLATGSRAAAQGLPARRDHRGDLARRLCRYLDGGGGACPARQGDHQESIGGDRAGIPAARSAGAHPCARSRSARQHAASRCASMIRQSLETWGPVVEAAKIVVE